jgi:Fe-S-cluster containining protein
MSDKKAPAFIDCDAGRKLGCKSFCCRLLVRLEENERHEVDPVTNRLKGFVDKKENGKCTYQDDETGLCNNWENRPNICRQYDCNFDNLLQVVIRSGGESIADWMKDSVKTPIEKKNYIYVPEIEVE